MVTPQTSREDHAKFEALYLSNYKPIYAYVHRRVLQTSDVPDIVSEVFAVAWRRFGDLAASPQVRLQVQLDVDSPAASLSSDTSSIPITPKEQLS